MGDKETFASELDRLLWPYIEWLDDNQILSADPAHKHGEGADEEYHRYFVDDPDSGITLNWWSDDAGPVNGFDVTWKGQSVYQRAFGGPTVMLRPGDWVLGLVAFTQAKQDDTKMLEMKRALDKAMARIPNFAPV
jgi:hypothetical protein